MKSVLNRVDASLVTKRKTGNRLLAIPGLVYGGAKRDRTADLHTASVALSQLSYGPIIKPNTEGQTTRCGREYSHEHLPVSTSFGGQ
jgi:hypothetical protein